MKAVILCAGYGERLKPLTDILPKPLFPILGRPLLEHIIHYLKQFGVNEIGVNTHWLAEKVSRYLEDSNKFGVKSYISHEPQILGIGGGIRAMREFLTEDIFIVHNGDVLSNIDINPAVEFHLKEQPLVTLVLHDYPEFNNVAVDSNNIIDIGDRVQGSKSSRGVQELKLAYTGIAIMSNKVLDFLPYKKLCSIIDVWIELIKSRPGSLKGYVLWQTHGSAFTKHYWADIGSVSGYLGVHRAILVDRVPLLSSIPNQEKILAEGKVGVSGQCVPASVYVGENSTISELTKITGFASIGKNCIIGDDVLLEDCVVWDNTVVRSRIRAKKAVLYPDGILKCKID